ncbi:MAG: LapA family protein [Xylophilus ampelinus]
MSIRTLLLLITAVVIAALAALNWNLLAAPVPMSVGFRTVEAPLGLVMLALTIVLAIVFAVYIAYLQSTALLESRRLHKDLDAQRALADQAEASRFTELRGVLESLHQQAALDARQAREAIEARIERLDRGLHARLEESDNSSAAYLGQLEDRLDRRAPSGHVAPVVVHPAGSAGDRHDPLI